MFCLKPLSASIKAALFWIPILAFCFYKVHLVQAQVKDVKDSTWKLSEQETSLLEDRIKIRLPLIFKVGEIQKDLSTELVWQEGSSWAKILVHEIYEGAAKNVEANIHESGRYGGFTHFRVETFLKKRNFTIYQIIPSAWEKRDKEIWGIPLYAFQVVIPGTTSLVVRVDIKVENKEILAKLGKIIEESVKTLRPGSKKINLATRRELIKIPFYSQKLSVKIPKNFVLIPLRDPMQAEKETADTYLIRSAVPIAAAKYSRGQLEISFGPNLSIEEKLKDRLPEYVELKKPLFGKEHLWFEQKNEFPNKEISFFRFTSYPEPKDKTSLPQINITFDDVRLEEYPIFEQIVESMKLVEVK